jgi:hypothetical protein
MIGSFARLNSGQELALLSLGYFTSGRLKVSEAELMQ